MSNKTSKKYFPALGYNFLTKFYDLIIKILLPNSFRLKLIKNIKTIEGDKILDFGVGTAELSILIKRIYPHVEITGIDVDPQIVQIASRKTKKSNYDIPIILYNGGQLGFSDNSFDIVVACLVFCNLKMNEKQFYINEIYRVLKPSGHFYICDLGYEENSIKRLLFQFFRSLTPLRPLLTGR